MHRRMLLAIAVALVAIGAGLWLLIPRTVEEIVALPHLDQLHPEEDRRDQEAGESELLLFSSSDTLFLWSTRLVKVPGKVEWPYAGMRVNLEHNGKCADWSNRDTLYLRLSSSLASGLSLGLDTRVPYDPSYPDAGKMRRLQMAVPSAREIRDYSIGIADLQVPQWWKEQYRLSLLDNRGFLESVCAINLINTSDLQRTDEIDTTILLSMALRGKSTSNPLGGLLVLLGTLSLLLPLWRPQPFGMAFASSPSQVQLRDHERELGEKITAWYDEHYMENDLTMARAARGIGLHPKKLQLLLRALFQTTHKAKLKEMRLLEASRLLRENDHPVGEIALSVGFNTVSHFNRSFKERFGHSPLEHRSAEEKSTTGMNPPA